MDIFTQTAGSASGLHTNQLLLSTKLKMPAPRKNYVVRRPLFEKLSRCNELGVIFVRGGAGTGKTTLLSSFIRETGLQRVGWLSLDSTNTNVYGFWLYFAAAVGSFLPDDGDFLGLMRAIPDVSCLEGLLTLLINRLCGEDDCYLVLDDIHCISDPALIKTIEFFVGAMPENLHIFMLSREDPPVYLGPLAVSGRLLFIDGRQMLLSPEEGMAFLKQTLSLPGSDEELAKINSYAEGWIGGLQLAAAAGTTALARNGRSAELLRAGGGIAAAYLTREIFESLTEEEQTFLTATGALPYFDAELCIGLFEGFSKPAFNRMIEALIQKNLFVICVDENGGVYRYHNILSDYLARQFSQWPDERQHRLMKQAAHAYAARGDLSEALRAYGAAGAYDELITTAHEMGGSIEAWSYLDEVPLDRLIDDAELTAQCFMYNFGRLDLQRCRTLYERLRERYGGTDIFRALQFAEPYLSRDENILPEYHAISLEQIDAFHLSAVTKAMILVENTAALVEQTRYEEAEICVNSAITASAGINSFVEFLARTQLAQLYEETGRFNESLICYEKSLKAFNFPAMTPAIANNYYIGLTGVLMRRMELDQAEQTLEKSRKLMEEQRISVDIVVMTLIYHLAELDFLKGNAQAGAACVEELVRKYSAFSVLTMGRLLLELDCAGLLPQTLADRFLKELADNTRYGVQPFMRLLRARILFSRGEEETALEEVDAVRTLSLAKKNLLHLVDADILKAVMLCRSTGAPAVTPARQRSVANLVREAVYYACENRNLMPFYLNRAYLLQPLHALAAKTGDQNCLNAGEMTFVRDAIAICEGKSVSASTGTELLSARELEVLRELARGITNREIADHLCISQATVKTHLLSIFGKLGVPSRLSAVAEARKQGILS